MNFTGVIVLIKVEEVFTFMGTHDEQPCNTWVDRCWHHMTRDVRTPTGRRKRRITKGIIVRVDEETM